MWPNPQDPEDLVTFSEEIFSGKLHFFEVQIFLNLFCSGDKRLLSEFFRKWDFTDIMKVSPNVVATK